MNSEEVVKSNQEQAVASWVGYLNQVRIDRLLDDLKNQKDNLELANAALEEAHKKINDEIIGRNRGGLNGMHGFIAEVAECGVGNARKLIEGKQAVYQWINDNGPVDLIRGFVKIQQKFSQSSGHLSLRAVSEHLESYPDFISNGGKYQIPKDHYDKIMFYLTIPEPEAVKMPTSNGEFSLRQWMEVRDFAISGKVPLKSLEPSLLGYKSVQAGQINNTLEQEKENIQELNKQKRDAAYQKSKPTVSEGAKVVLGSAAVEGATALCFAIAKKRKAGKQFAEFDEKDWWEITGETGIAFSKGGIRGLTLYGLTNFTATPASVANALVTTAFSIAEQAHLLRTGKITEFEFIENSEMLCLDAAVSAFSSYAGQALIPVPVLGAVIGNTLGTVMYKVAKDSLSEREQRLVNEYVNSIREQSNRLSEEYQQLVEISTKNMVIYMELLDQAFSTDIDTALLGSVELAKSMGVPTEELLDSHEKITQYFML